MFETACYFEPARSARTNRTKYAYDANGNRTHEREDLGGGPIAAYDSQDRLTSHAGRNYTYSEAGELETLTESSQTTTYSYDPLGSLLSVCIAGTGPSCTGGTLIAYEVDALGRRIGKRVNGTLQRGFLWSDYLRVLAELDGSGAVVSRFVYGLRTNVPEYMVKDGNTYRILTDHLGSVRLAVDAATGAIAQRIDYDVWGVVLADSNPGFQPFGFAGGLHDPDTGLVRFGARDYDARTGRWTSKDPTLFDGADENVYRYGGGDPLNSYDDSGLSKDTYRPDPHAHGGPHIDRVTKDGHHVGRYLPDGTPLQHKGKIPPQIPNADKARFEKAAEKLRRRFPGVGCALDTLTSECSAGSPNCEAAFTVQ